MPQCRIVKRRQLHGITGRELSNAEQRAKEKAEKETVK